MVVTELEVSLPLELYKILKISGDFLQSLMKKSRASTAFLEDSHCLFQEGEAFVIALTKLQIPTMVGLGFCLNLSYFNFQTLSKMETSVLRLDSSLKGF